VPVGWLDDAMTDDYDPFYDIYEFNIKNANRVKSFTLVVENHVLSSHTYIFPQP
jgi:hypothetical protein